MIGGWLPGKGARAGRLGALLVGYYEPAPGTKGGGPRLSRCPALRRPCRHRLRRGELERLGGKLETRARDTSPFSGTQPPREARFVEPGSWPRSSSASGRASASCATPSTRACARTSLPRQVRLEEPMTEAPYEVVHETKRAAEIEVQGRTLKLTNREKVMYPRSGFTKGDLIDYYAAVAPVLLPTRRPAADAQALSRRRRGQVLRRERCPPHRPDWCNRADRERARARHDRLSLAERPAALIWAANLADIELAPVFPGAADGPPDSDRVRPRPRRSGGPEGVRSRGALDQGDFDSFGLETFVKTSGSKGLQVYAPLNTPVS